MAVTKIGKKFEEVFERDWKKLPNAFIYRLHDQVSGYKVVSSNPCDYICFAGHRIFLIECKEHKGKSFPFSELRQYEKLAKYAGVKDVYGIVVLWLKELDTVIAIPIEAIIKMKEDGKKSVNLNDIEKYGLLKIPSEKKVVYMDSDYSSLLTFANYNTGDN